MPYNLRSGKNTNSPQDIDTALVMLKLHKNSADERIQAEKELEKNKKELENLKLIKQYTDQYNTLTMLVRLYQTEIDKLESYVSELISTIN